MPSNGINNISVPIRFLSDVKSHKRKAKGRYLAEKVQKASISNRPIATGTKMDPPESQPATSILSIVDASGLTKDATILCSLFVEVIE
ncbi:hypothetical protein M5K25_025362 [Dendrobium thyrsiflorum]|uniref:Uncharacterized protein n=1 Tax=Dendrobium thyrsiflorum TaxID=117978 RepID=A0ABD0U8W1_DENTH